MKRFNRLHPGMSTLPWTIYQKVAERYRLLVRPEAVLLGKSLHRRTIAFTELPASIEQLLYRARQSPKEIG